MDYLEYRSRSSHQSSVLSMDFRKCTSCAHKEYCELGAECANENYQYHFPFSKVRELDGSFTYSLGGGWL